MSTFIASEAPWLKGLPAGWTPKSLRFVLQNNDGGAWGVDPNGEDDVVVLRSTEQTAGGYWNIEEPAYRSLAASEHQATCLLKGDLLVTKSSGSALHIGKTTLVDDDVAALRAGFSNFMQRLRVEDGVEPKFVWYLLNSDQAKLQINLESTTTTGLANLNGGLLGRLIFAFPDPSIQIAIAAYLDAETKRIDALIEGKDHLLDLLLELKRNTLTKAIHEGINPGVAMKKSELSWFSELPSHWTLMRLKRVIDGIENGWSPQCEGEVAAVGQWGVLKAGACNGGVFRADENKALPSNELPRPELEVKPGNVLMSRASGSLDLVGSVAFVHEIQPRLMLSDKIFRLNFDVEEVCGEWLTLALNSSPMRRQIASFVGGSEGLARNIASSDIRELLLPVPPHDEQVEIVRVVKQDLERIEELVLHVNQENAVLKELRSATITDAVLGRIDVLKNVKKPAREAIA